MPQRFSGTLALLSLLAVLGFRLAGPLSLDANDQAKQALYALDIRQNGNWILPQERGTVPATKPPLYAWLAAAGSALWSADGELGCRIPSMLAFLAIGWLVFRIGAERWNSEVGALAVMAFASSHIPDDLAVQIRPDMLMTALILLAWFALHRAERGRARGMPLLFWLAISLSALAKGPVAPLIVGAGIALAWLTPPLRAPLRSVVCSPWSALLALPLLWLLLAYQVGQGPWINDTVLPETVDRVLASGTRAGQGVEPGYLVPHLLGKSLPWSLFALAAIGITLRRRRANEKAPPERLLVSLLVGGLAVISLSRELRPDYALPYVPLVALLAAAVLLELAPRASRAAWQVGARIAGVCLAALGLAAFTGKLAAPPLAVGWEVCVAAAIGLVLAAGSIGPRSDRLRVAQVLPGIAALLLLQSLYNAAFSPVARSPVDAQLRAFVREASARLEPRDRLELMEGVPRSVFFWLESTRPELSFQDLESFAAWRPRGGRLLLVLPDFDAAPLEQRWPGRFRRLASGPLVLVEDSQAEELPPGRPAPT